MPNSVRGIDVDFLEYIVWVDTSPQPSVEPRINNVPQPVSMLPKQFRQRLVVARPQSFHEVAGKLRVFSSAGTIGYHDELLPFRRIAMESAHHPRTQLSPC